jgi:hypothetical protein
MSVLEAKVLPLLAQVRLVLLRERKGVLIAVPKKLKPVLKQISWWRQLQVASADP